MMDRAPSCAILHNRNELKIYQGNIVYLNDGDNFELRFFNPLSEKIGVEINFNGLKKGEGYLVLNPGQDLILDRFLDEQRKMIFETYTIDGNNEAAVKAIEQNGVIQFNFFKEYYSSTYPVKDIDINYSFPPKPPKPTVYNTYNNYYYGTGGGTSGFSGSSGTSGTSGIAGVAGHAGLAHYTSCSGGEGGYSTLSNLNGMGPMQMQKDYWFPSTSTSNIPVMDSFNSYSDNSDAEISYSEYPADNLLETGRIEKGEISKQTLKGVNLQFATTPFYSVTYKILPYSQMNRTIGEIRQYCTGCGYRIRKDSWHYCPKCGTELQ
jgi:hypothetical protein